MPRRALRIPHRSQLKGSQLCVTGCKDLYIYSYYRPNVSEEVIPEHLNESLNWISHKNCHLWLAGDLNLPGLDWSAGTNCNPPPLHEHFLMDDNSLTKHITQPTWQNNTLDLFLCNDPSLIENDKVIPGLADHDAVLVEGNISPIVNKKTPRKIHLF